MLKSNCTYQTFDWSTMIKKFEELSGWESTQNGVWNCKFDKPVTFEIEFYENYMFQHEQDYVYFHPYCPSEPDDPNQSPINLQKIKDNGITKIFFDNNNLQKIIHVISFTTIIQYLQETSELPDQPVIISNCY